jgi:hypothetical protein
LFDGDFGVGISWGKKNNILYFFIGDSSTI